MLHDMDIAIPMFQKLQNSGLMNFNLKWSSPNSVPTLVSVGTPVGIRKNIETRNCALEEMARDFSGNLGFRCD